jgi:hypothetical protein
MKSVMIFLGILSVEILGCNYIPCSASSDLDKVKKISNAASISGIYKPDTFTKRDYKEYSNSDSTFLLLSEDGKITLKNFPIETFGSWSNQKTRIVNGSGTWTSSTKSGTTIIRTKIAFDQPKTMTPAPFRLFRKKSKHYILIDFGDPDACESVRLEQQ